MNEIGIGNSGNIQVVKLYNIRRQKSNKFTVKKIILIG